MGGGGSEISRLWLENKVKLKCFCDIFKDSAPKDGGGSDLELSIFKLAESNMEMGVVGTLISG